MSAEGMTTVQPGARQPLRERTHAGGLRRSAWGGWLVWVHCTEGDETGNTDTEAASSEAKARLLAKAMADQAGWVAPRVERTLTGWQITGYDPTPDLVYNPDTEDWEPQEPRYPRGVQP